MYMLETDEIHLYLMKHLTSESNTSKTNKKMHGNLNFHNCNMLNFTRSWKNFAGA